MRPVVHESLVLILIKIEDSACLAANASHSSHRVNDSWRPEASKDGEDCRDAESSTNGRFELHSDHAILTSDQTASVESCLVVARNVGEGCAEGSGSVSSFLFDQGLSCLDEER